MLVKYTLQTSSGYSRKIQDYIQGRGRTSDFVFPNGCKNVRPGKYLFQQRTIELLFKEIIVRRQRTGQACSGHCLGKRLSKISEAEVPPSPLPTGTGLALSLLAEAPCAEGSPTGQPGSSEHEAHGSVSSGLLEALQPMQVCWAKSGSLNSYSFTPGGGWVKVKGSSCELSLPPAISGKGYTVIRHWHLSASHWNTWLGQGTITRSGQDCS